MAFEHLVRLQLLASGLAFSLMGCGASGLPIDWNGDGAQTGAQNAAGVGGAANGRVGAGGTAASGVTTSRPGTNTGVAGASGPPGNPAGGRPASADGGVSTLPGNSSPNNPGLPSNMPTEAGVPHATVCASGTFVGDVTLATPVDVVRVKGCQTIDGNLFVAGRVLSDLHGLEALQTITGSLQISPDGQPLPFDPSGIADPNSLLTTLSGLDGLRTVNGRVAISGLPLSSIASLKGLTTAGSLYLNQLSALTDLTGLEQVNWSSAVISGNAVLRTLTGLHTPSSLSSLEIIGDPQLADIGALKTVQSLTWLTLRELPALTSLAGLQQLSSVAGPLSILQCDALQDLTGLGSKLNVAALVVEQNAQLRTLAGVSIVGTPKLITIVDDPMLASLAGLIGPNVTSVQQVKLAQLPALKTLSDLSAVQQADSIAIQTCDALGDLSGLEQLTTIVNLDITDCVRLKSLKGLDALATVSNRFALQSLPALTTLQTLAKLTSAITVTITDTQALPSLTGLEQLAEVQTLDLENDRGLQSVDGLSAITQLRALTLNNDPALNSLAALAQLHSIAQTLSISSDGALISLTGVEQVHTVGALTITQNMQLDSLHAFSSLKTAGMLQISGNSRLPQCEVTWLAKQVGQIAPSSTNGPADAVCP